MRSIPRAKPAPLFEAEAPLNSAPWLEKPVVDGDRVLLAGGGVSATSGRVTILAALDAQNGAQRWQVDLDLEARELFAGLPCVIGGRRVLVPISEARDAMSVDVLTIDADGGIVSRKHLAREDDAGTDPLLQAVRVLPAKDGYITSWRGAGAWTLSLPNEASPTAWLMPEWLVGAAGNLAILQRQSDEYELLARRLVEGTLVWRAGIEAPVVAHVSDAHVIALDSHDRRAQVAVADEDWDEHLGSRTAPVARSPDDVARVGAHLSPQARPPHARDFVSAPIAIVSLDPANGAERWRRRLEADVTSLIAAPHAICAIAVHGKEGRLHRFTRDGEPLGDSPLPGVPEGRESDPNAWPALIALDHTHVLWASKDRLVCEVLADPGRIVWDLELPVPGRGFHVGPIEGALAERSIAVADERIYLRERNRLWAWASSA